jgi:hypothetical protein
VKYEDVYLSAYESTARVSLGRHPAFYTAEIRHQLLERRTPDSVYDESAAKLAACPEDALIALSHIRGPLLRLPTDQTLL